MNSKYKLIILCGFVFILIAAMCLLGSVEFAGRLDESNTTQLVATVTDVIYEDFEKQDNIKIYTDEYNNCFLISAIVTSNIDLDTYKAITTIQKGEIICFKIENTKVEQINEVEFIDIVSLELSEDQIFSIEDYNEYHHKTSIPGKFMCVLLIVLAIIALTIMKTKKTGDGSVSWRKF